MEIAEVRELLTQVQAGARVTTAIGEPVTVGERVVIPVAVVSYGGGGGGGGGKNDLQTAGGSGGGLGIRVRPLGCWIIGPNSEKWVPALDITRLAIIAGGVATLLLVTIRALARRR